MRHSLKIRFLMISILALGVLSLTRLMTAPLPNVYLQKAIANIDYWVTNERGDILTAKSTSPLPVPWGELTLPEKEGELMILPSSSLTNFISVMRLNTEGTRFRVLQKKTSAFTIALVTLIAFLRGLVVWGTPVAMASILYFQHRARVAQRVIDQLKRGNLSARFPLGPIDGVGLLMQQFNSMAEELEVMMKRLHQAEAARGQLLKELAHDLQTPLTSLSFCIESVADGAYRMKPEVIQAKMNSAAHEMQYFKRLLEDLFLLERANEIHREGHEKKVDLGTQISLETKRWRDEPGRIRVDVETSEKLYLVDGSPQLLRRLVHNAVENSLRFAQSRISISLHSGENQVRFCLRDDGAGFTQESLEGYGKKLPTRLLNLSTPEGRISLGLGSVIIRRIVEIHGGTFKVSNWRKPDGSVGGAELEITLPAVIRDNPHVRAA